MESEARLMGQLGKMLYARLCETMMDACLQPSLANTKKAQGLKEALEIHAFVLRGSAIITPESDILPAALARLSDPAYQEQVKLDALRVAHQYRDLQAQRGGIVSHG